jgi:hypothetical protein
VLALGGLALAVWFFTAGDDATTSAPVGAVPGVAFTGPAPHPAELTRGNVVLTVERAGDAAAARALARDVSGADTAALRAAGQAVIVDAPRPDAVGGNEIECSDRAGKPVACPTVVAYAHGRAFTGTDIADPRLRTFLDYWLGRAAG